MADSVSFDLVARRRIHIIGAGGAGMSGLAKLLSQQGHRVTGSDLKPSSVLDGLADSGVETWVGHRPDRLGDTELVVASTAVPQSDPELRAAVDAGLTVWRRPTLLNALTAAIPTVGIAGTHGKTTSSALAVSAIRACGQDPSFVIGGEITALNTGAHLGDQDLLVLEADEAFGTFRHLHLSGMLVTNIEADHLDHYETVSALEEAFAQVAASTDGPVLGCIDDAGVKRLAERTEVIGYGTSETARWRVTDLSMTATGVSFRLDGPQGAVDVTVPQPGAHIARNAAGVVALFSELGLDSECLASGLASFGGVRRRFEVKARVGGVTILEDYAHHPTEVEVTIAAARQVTAGRLWVVFQPHRYTRTADLAPAFGAPLAAADHIIVTDVYGAGERPQPGVSGRIVAEAVAAAGGSVEYVPMLSDVPALLRGEMESGDTIVLMGAGDVASIWPSLAAGDGPRA
ncbi:MAG: UDP-N-acetylmuramate--L-alanine ligase [Acidimicrobiia bacterium]|nr:MAG: UDP-N-acetylmuramate--L-alanine ligase [Acidimicrobiia bacterium]